MKVKHLPIITETLDPTDYGKEVLRIVSFDYFFPPAFLHLSLVQLEVFEYFDEGLIDSVFRNHPFPSRNFSLS